MSPDSLVRMANQIAANQQHLPDDEAAEAVALHLRQFWTPGMRADLLAYEEAGGTGLSAVARQALHQLVTA